MKRKQLIVIAVVALVIIGGGAWYLTTNKQTTEKNRLPANATTDIKTATVANDNKFAKLTGDTYDETYIADMFAHHEETINMAEMAGVSTERRELLQLAQTIMQTQSQELLKMQTWQQEWGFAPIVGSHAGMGTSASGKMMMMGDELTDLKGIDFEKKFLELMLEHYQQAIAMSKYADTNASRQEIKDLANAIITTHEAEITQMKQWQKEWGFDTTTQ